MRRTYNYTDRSKIRKKSIEIDLNRDEEYDRIEGVELSLDPGEIEVDDEEALVVLEGRYRTEYVRKDLDPVSELQENYDLELDEPVYSESLRFRVIVVNSEGRILSQADEINPQEDEKERILRADIDDIGRRGIWEIQYKGRRGAPVLVLNKNAGIRRSNLENDPEFRLSVLPSAFRSILERMVFVEDIRNPEDPAVEWHEHWLVFTEKVLGKEKPEDMNWDSNAEREELEKWIDDNVELFTELLSSDWNKVQQGWGE